MEAETRAAESAESTWLKGAELDASFSLLAPGPTGVNSAESATESAAGAEVELETVELEIEIEASSQPKNLQKGRRSRCLWAQVSVASLHPQKRNPSQGVQRKRRQEPRRQSGARPQQLQEQGCGCQEEARECGSCEQPWRGSSVGSHGEMTRPKL